MDGETMEQTCETPFVEEGEKKGLIHIYTGQGKGKTTSSIGLCVRAAGQGFKVLLVQFFKLEEDPSGEKEIIRKSIPNIELIRSKVRHPCFTGEETDKAELKRGVVETFELVKSRLSEGTYNLLVLDEVIGAINGGWIDLKEFIEFLDKKPEGLEVVLTGRDAPVELVKKADYVTEMLKIKHPYERGIKARRGIEF
jgi:cob(I)alamin adenosyltransferase